MSEYNAQIKWQRASDEVFTDGVYSRGHEWRFDGGAVIPASSSPHVVPLPLSVEANVDPEEAFVASLSSCHMLFFLSIAAKRRWVVDRYSDDAIGTMAEDDTGRLAMTQVLLQPVAQFQGVAPSQEQIEQVHHQAHEMCFIANSVKTRVLVTPKPFRNEST